MRPQRKARWRLAETSAAAKRLRTRSALDAAPAATAILREDGSLAYANRAFVALTSREWPELKSLSIDDLVDVDDGVELRRALRHIRSGRSESAACAFRIDHLRLRAEMARADSGIVIQLREEPAAIPPHVTAEWRATLDAVQMPVLLLDHELRVLRLNRAAAAAAAADFRDLLDRPVDSVRACEPWRSAAYVAQTTLATNQNTALEVRDETSDATWEIAAWTVPGARRVVVTARDITAVHQLHETVRRAELLSVLGSLVGGVAHEVRNPLFNISATFDALEAKFRQLDGIAPYLCGIRRDVRRLVDLMNDLLEYGKPRALELRPCALAPLLTEAALVCEPLSLERRVAVTLRVESDLPPALLDRERIVVVFKNLIENALVFSKPGDEVTVSAGITIVRGSLWISCSVADRGPGFAPDTLPRLFEPFFTRRPGGTGLGLALVQRIVFDHGGAVTASNRGGGGAELEVLLPAAPET